ncbi:MAG TPA: TIGR03560 family F420-dependent LLM class oxidoreductase [Acidimicrobiia bacterium]|nr:TIGR03560 family F420-dependent LLM class oxidoreductase [Acidimicrobiia bacterium]
MIHFGALVPVGRRMELAGLPDVRDKWIKLVDTACHAEALGYDSVWVYDHLHNVPRPAGEAVFESTSALAALSQVTSRVRLGQMVGNNLLRSPALVAKAIATLDVMSAGRVEWGIGTGWERTELEAYGYDFPSARERVERLREAIAVARVLWTRTESTFDGTYYRLAGAQCDPKPLQRPHPPVWIGGKGEQLTLRVVAEHADYSNFGGSPPEWAHTSDVLAAHCEAVGREFADITRTWSHDAFVRATDSDVRAGDRRGLWGESFERWRDENLVGTPAEVIDKIGCYSDLGCRGFVIWCADYPSWETLERFALDVMPAFRSG